MKECTPEEWAEIEERCAQDRLGISADEFRRRWADGTYHWGHDHPDHCMIAPVAMLMGFE